MSSLAEVYEGQVGEYASLRRLYLGVGSFSFGAILVSVGIVVAATDLTTAVLGWNLGQARETAGILAGLGLPATFLGVLVIMPTSRRTQAAAVVGTGVAALGVALFAHAYPCHWSGANCAGQYADLTLPTAGVYFLGAFTTFWCLFTGVANFKARNNPGGTVTLEITREGETKVIEVPKSTAEEIRGANGATGRVGGIGLLGTTPDGSVETQTNRPEFKQKQAETAGTASTGGADNGSLGSGTPGAAAGAASDGGASSSDITPLADRQQPESASEIDRIGPSAERSATGSSAAADAAPARTKSPGDSYCGSCGHFQYVRTDQGMQPYCSLHDDLMDDMDACDDWNPR
ncbi:DUF7139 domain-containing protein [Halobaculum gomorrense]|uniref:Uncharacterized protein n=1 Tax=Halobaculum gomorrense TaxID=43928 RepID=A0A1M5UWH5_9EURY|nr:hypothetical protein [Halobaculum gomorrense]SHH67228.1 hypothetical protein SAMN05443636_3144 [Halobaculum gomorrense]